MAIDRLTLKDYINVYYFNPSRPYPRRWEKINLNFYFHTSLWCFKGFHEGLKGLYKTFWGTTKKSQNKNLNKFLFYYNFLRWTEREGLIELLKSWLHAFSISSVFVLNSTLCFHILLKGCLILIHRHHFCFLVQISLKIYSF